jgi:hypothetical protein
MTAQGDRTVESAAAKEANEVDEIVLELPDISRQTIHSSVHCGEFGWTAPTQHVGS